MRVTWEHLTIKFDPGQSEELLSDWRWLVGDDLQVLMVSALGDLFLDDSDGRIHWLDLGAGQVSVVAKSIDEFNQLRATPGHAAKWFIPQLVGDLIQSSMQLAPGECYSYKVPPMLNGRIEPSNFAPASLRVHCSMLGQIARKIRKLPAGTKIKRVTIS